MSNAMDIVDLTSHLIIFALVKSISSNYGKAIIDAYNVFDNLNYNSKQCGAPIRSDKTLGLIYVK
jgi:hypothetical protein